MAYVNPIGPGLQVGRIDEGVDFSGKGPLYAITSGTIVATSASGWPGTNYILLHTSDNKYVYYAENIAPAVHVGQQVQAGQLIGTARGAPPYIEIGWASSTPGNALAHGHYTEGVPTAEGKDFAALLNSLGNKVPGAATSSSLAGSGGTGASAGGTGANILSGCLPLVGVIYAICHTQKLRRNVPRRERRNRRRENEKRYETGGKETDEASLRD